jgi:hypothetical protein
MDTYLWNTRGRVVKIDTNNISDYLARGYLQPTKEDLERIEAGNLIYSQIYDQGESSNVVRKPIQLEKVSIEKKGNVLETEEI